MNNLSTLPDLTCERAGKLADYLDSLPLSETEKFTHEWWTEKGNPWPAAWLAREAGFENPKEGFSDGIFIDRQSPESMESDCYGVMEEALSEQSSVYEGSIRNYSDMFESQAGTDELIELLRGIANE